jgi:hypothetical protein
MTVQLREIKVRLGQLMLDPNNYRLNNGDEPVDYTDNQIITMQNNVQSNLVKENISDLESSMLENGFLEVDKIVVQELKNLNFDEPKYLVIEGNRRTLAFKSIINEYGDLSSEPNRSDLVQRLINKSKEINVILVDGSDSEILDYSYRLMGIRHVSGPKQWGGFQSARLIHSMYQDKDYKAISSLLGMRPGEAKRRHETYLAFKQMQEDEIYSSKASTNYFTLLSEFVASNKSCKEDWLGWNKESKKFENIINLHRVYEAIIKRSDGIQELSNPPKAREFIKALGVDGLRREIELGIPLDELSYYDWDSSKMLKRVEEFEKFLEKFSSPEKEQVVALKRLMAIIDRVVSEAHD